MHVYFPFQTVLQFLLYIGWLKIAEKLLHPFGDEDDDFELNYILGKTKAPKSELYSKFKINKKIISAMQINLGNI